MTFTLHNSFPKPLREMPAPPFEVREEGWGEFDVAIRVRHCDLSSAHVHVMLQHSCWAMIAYRAVRARKLLQCNAHRGQAYICAHHAGESVGRRSGTIDTWGCTHLPGRHMTTCCMLLQVDFTNDANEPPLKLTHRLKLFHDGALSACGCEQCGPAL